MKFLRMCKAVALTALLSIAALPAMAQSLTTTYAGGNSQDGILFDLTPSVDITVDSFDVNLGASTGTQVPVDVYWRAGTVQGNQNNATGWTLLGSASVVAQGPDTATSVPIGGLGMASGQTYGIYIRVSNTFGQGSIRYTNSSDPPPTTSNGQLALRSFYGHQNEGAGNPLLSGSFFYPRQFNGTVYYHLGITPAVTCASEGYTGTKLTWCQNICEKGYTGAALDMWIHRWVNRYRDLPYCAREGNEEPPPQEG